MKRSSLLPGLCVALASLVVMAASPEDSAPSALVTLAKLHKGSLPKVTIAYGKVEPSAAARLTVTAAVSAEVAAVYVRAGQTIAKGAPLLRLAPSPATAAAYVQAKSAAGVAAQLVARTRQMVGQHLATAQQLADAEKSQADAQAALAALEAQGAAGARNLPAPFDAIVAGVSASPGALVGEGAVLVELMHPEGLVLKAGLVPAEAAAVAPGDAASIVPIGGGDPVAGSVVLRGSIVDASTGLVPLDIALTGNSLMPGETAQARITTGEAEGFVVPHEAILVDDNGDTYVVQIVNTVAKKIPARIIAAAGDEDVVDGALDPSAPLVLAGNHQLEDGMKVRVAEPGGTPTE